MSKRKQKDGLPSMSDFTSQWMEEMHENTPPVDQAIAAKSYYYGLGDAVSELKLLTPHDRLKLIEKWYDEYMAWLEEQIEKPDIGWNASQQDPRKQ